MADSIGEGMPQDSLIVTLDKSGNPSQEGASLDDFLRVLEGVSRAMRLMVEHLGERERTPGQPPAWVRDQSQLQIAPLETGSLIAELSHSPPAGKQLRIENFGPRAFEALRDWDGTEGSTLPKPVTDCLYETASGLESKARVYLGSREHPKRIRVTPRGSASRSQADTEPALLAGWLKEVNWDKETAQLHDFSGGYVRLRFGPGLADEMLRLATQYVEVRGEGRFNNHDRWTTVEVHGLRATASGQEPFDLDDFLDEAPPKAFDPKQMVTATEPFDVDAFVRSIREARDA